MAPRGVAEASSLPAGEASPNPGGGAISHAQRIFCNRHMKMTGISWIGFDMDYTLAIYNQEAMDELSIRATIQKLLARGYPELIRNIPCPTDFPVRGLLIDKKHGNVLKMDRFKYVCKGYHGLRELGPDELRDLYHSSKVRVTAARYHFIDTLYALSEVALYASIIDAFEKHGIEVDYGVLFADIRACIDEAHRDGTILDTMAADLPKYVHRDPNLAATLHKLRSAGKKLFLLTNSGWTYSDAMMTYLLGDAMPEYPSWRNFFDLTICAAKKPSFFRDGNPFLERLDGAQKIAGSSAAVGNERLRAARFPLERGRVYENGNIADLQRSLGVHGDEVLYVGDHIFGDILRSRKDTAWRTAMIIQELETEVAARIACQEDYALADRCAEMRDGLEDDLRYYQQRYKELSRQIERSAGVDDDQLAALGAERNRTKVAVDRIRGRLREIEREGHEIERRTELRFHPYWGSLLKEHSEQSSFGQQVEDYACVYTSRVSNFANYSPQQTFRSPRDEMPHELGLPTP